MIALVDTNIFLDVLLEREPFRSYSEKVIATADLGIFEAYCCATTITDIFYIARKKLGTDKTKDAIRELIKKVNVAPVEQKTITAALASEMSDLEDAILSQAALGIRASCIVARNLSDFPLSEVPAYGPEEFLNLLSPPT